jgi:RNA polymerase sigma-70 factor (ECF subfamily)
MMARPDQGAGLADEELMLEIVRGDEAAFDLLYQRHARVMFSLAHRLVGDREAAEDLLQDAMLSAWRNAAAYVPARGSVRSWLLGNVRNRGIDLLRAWSTRSRRDAALAGERKVEQESADSEGRLVDRSMAGDVRRGLGDLPHEQSEVLSLAYFGGFTQSEIADLLSVPLGTVKSRMRLGLERLREGMMGHGEAVTG